MSSDPTDAMIEFFEKAAHATFGRSRTFSNRMTRALLILGRYESEYSAAPLASELSTFFGEASLFAPARSRNFQSTTRVAVTTARDEGGTECIIANYNRPLGNWTRFEREDDAEKDMKVWEAGLATSAAPFYLPPFRKQNADYVDGAVFANCPAKVAIEEVGKLWPNEGTSLDILLSLGTGHQTKKKPKIPKAIRYGVFIPILHMFERQMDTERIWAELVRSSNANVEARLHRLNPDIQGQAGDYVDINHHQELEHLLYSVDEWAKTTGAARIEQPCSDSQPLLLRTRSGEPLERWQPSVWLGEMPPSAQEPSVARSVRKKDCRILARHGYKSRSSWHTSADEWSLEVHQRYFWRQ